MGALEMRQLPLISPLHPTPTPELSHCHNLLQSWFCVSSFLEAAYVSVYMCACHLLWEGVSNESKLLNSALHTYQGLSAMHHPPLDEPDYSHP